MASQKRFTKSLSAVLKPRNVAAKAIATHSGNAGQAVAIDARPKIVAPKKGKGAPYKRAQNKFCFA